MYLLCTLLFYYNLLAYYGSKGESVEFKDNVAKLAAINNLKQHPSTLQLLKVKCVVIRF